MRPFAHWDGTLEERWLPPSAMFKLTVEALDEKVVSSQQTSDAGLLLGHRRRRWANSKPALGQRPFSAGFRNNPLIPR